MSESMMNLIGIPARESEFKKLVAENEKRIMEDDSQPVLQQQLKGMAEVVKERSKQNVITYSQFRPYYELFGRTDVTDVSVDDRNRRRVLFEAYLKVINPQEITIILSDDRKFVVGAHDRIFRKIASANPGEETLRINATIQTQQERNNAEAAGNAAQDLAAEVAKANRNETYGASIAKTTMDSILVDRIQKMIVKAQEAGLPGAPYEEPCKTISEHTVPDTTEDSEPSSGHSDPDEDTAVLL